MQQQQGLYIHPKVIHCRTISEFHTNHESKHHKMIDCNSKRQVGPSSSSSAKQEGSTDDGKNFGKASSSSTPWLRLKDPRIVRVSRAFGGKDRHSKVCTVRGLRDRRVRLSVPTAIQLYDLQDRLGLNQPSKVVDWLLDAAKHEIDELPPLPMLPSGTFAHQPVFSSSLDIDKENWRIGDKGDGEEDKQEIIRNEGHGAQASSGSVFNRVGGGLLNHNAMPYASFFQLDPQTFPLSHIGGSHTENVHNLNVVPLPSPLSLSPYFPNSASSMEIDAARQISHFQMVTNSSSPYSMGQSMRPFHFSVTQPADHKDHDHQFSGK